MSKCSAMNGAAQNNDCSRLTAGSPPVATGQLQGFTQSDSLKAVKHGIRIVPNNLML
ncbi:hypothetical protein CC2G_002516 [Coprinopsis cinerea AmutBmut pab1-1]|nr:hypothetical protein CC2G_002516 [Coprinopsis cinerea AmutBmut pab1-1]